VVESVVGPWAKEKLNCLAKYLEEYTKILRKQPGFTYIYVDAFSGSGTHRVRETRVRDTAQLDFTLLKNHLDEDSGHQEYLKGSPRVALEIQYPFSKYVFIESDPARARDLEALRDAHPERANDIVVRTGDCNEYISKRLLDPRRSWAKLRAVVFLDPFGMQVPWQTIERMAKTKAIEVFVNFPVGMAIQRLLRRDAQYTPSQQKKLDQYFGSSEWFDVVYRSSTGLFGAPLRDKAADSNLALTRWYQLRLKEHFGFASDPRLIRRSSNRPLYYLIHAGPNKTGARIAQYILST